MRFVLAQSGRQPGITDCRREPELLEKVLPHYPLGRMVTPQEVAQATLFLASSAASGITGTALAVDAGLTAGNLRFINDVLAGEI